MGVISIESGRSRKSIVHAVPSIASQPSPSTYTVPAAADLYYELPWNHYTFVFTMSLKDWAFLYECEARFFGYGFLALALAFVLSFFFKGIVFLVWR